MQFSGEEGAGEEFGHLMENKKYIIFFSVKYSSYGFNIFI